MKMAATWSDRSRVESLFGALVDLYREKHLPGLEHCTRETNKYLMDSYIEPKWCKTGIRDVKPLAVIEWLQKLSLAASVKANIRSVISQCFELAALHEYIPAMQRNPMSLVKIKGSSKLQKKVTPLTIEQFRKLLESLPEPLNIMTLVAGDLGFPFQSIVVCCPLRGECRQYLPSDVFLGRPNHLMAKHTFGQPSINDVCVVDYTTNAKSQLLCGSIMLVKNRPEYEAESGNVRARLLSVLIPVTRIARRRS